MLTVEGIGQALSAEPDGPYQLPPGSVSHRDLRAMLQDLKAQMATITDAVGQTKTAIETQSGQVNQGLTASQAALAAIQTAIQRVEALIAASL